MVFVEVDVEVVLGLRIVVCMVDMVILVFLFLDIFGFDVMVLCVESVWLDMLMLFIGGGYFIGYCEEFEGVV